MSGPPPHKRLANYSETLWPKRVCEDTANTITAPTEGNWNNIESVVIGRASPLMYAQHLDCRLDNTMSHGSCKIIGDTCGVVDLTCKTMTEELFGKVKFLYDQILVFPTIKSIAEHKLVCIEREGRAADPESDGEDIEDPPLHPAFEKTELLLVETHFRRLFHAYQVALNIGLYNAIGKNFMVAVGQYADLCLEATTSPFMYLTSTATAGPQPGALVIKWKLPPKQLRSTRQAMPSSRGKDMQTVSFMTHTQPSMLQSLR